MFQSKILEKYKYFEPLLFSIALTFVYFVTSNEVPTYDVVRNLIVSQEIQIRGIPTYFDSAFWLHPPLLYYLIAEIGTILNIPLYLAGKIVLLAFSFFSIFLFYLLCMELKDKSFARIAAVVLGVTPLFWSFTGEVMHEIPQTFFFILTMYSFCLAMKYAKRKYFMITGASLGLALLTKSQTVILVAVIVSYVWVKTGKAVIGEKSLIKNLVLMFAVAGIVFSPYVLYRSINNAPSFFGDTAFVELVTGKAAWSPTGDISSPVYTYVTDIFSIISYNVIFFAIGAFYIYKKKDKSMLLPVLWVIFSYLILSAFSHKVGRYMIVAVPAMVIISVYGLNEVAAYLKNKRYIYILGGILITALSINTIYSNNSSDYWPTDWSMWNELKSLNNSVLSMDLYKYSTVKMAYGTVKLMTGRYSDIITGDPQNDISLALMYNTPYLLYDGKPELEYPFIKAKYFGECNCTLYKIDESVLFGNKTLIKTTSEGKLLQGVNLYLIDFKGNLVYRSKSNINGEAYVPIEDYEGVLLAERICFNSLQTYIKIEDGKFNICDLKQNFGTFGLVQNYLECRQAQSIGLSDRGCLDNDFRASRY